LVFFSVKVFHFNIIDDILDMLSVQGSVVAGFNEVRFIRVGVFFLFCYVCVSWQWLFFTGMEISFCAFVNLRPYLWFIVIGLSFFVRIFGKGF